MSEIKNVRFLKSAKESKNKEKRRIWSAIGTVAIAAIVTLTSCGATYNHAENIPETKPVAQAVSYASYEVKPGDTISGIAAKFANRWSDDTPLSLIAEAIRERNAKLMPNGYVLQSGSVIEVPVWR